VTTARCQTIALTFVPWQTLAAAEMGSSRSQQGPAPAAESHCPRCGGAFHCGVNDPAPCACTTVKLDAATLAALRQHYQGCLCLDCLRFLASVGALAQPGAPSDAGAD